MSARAITPMFLFWLAVTAIARGSSLEASVAALPELAGEAARPIEADWLVAPIERRAGVYRTGTPGEIAMANGLVKRVWRLQPNAATVGFQNLMTGESLIRAVKPEAIVELDRKRHSVGGLLGQPDHAYLREEWLDRMTADPAAFRCTGFTAGKIEERFPWKRARHVADLPWPPPGVSLTFRYESPDESLRGLRVDIHYELYDGIPLLAKWLTIENGAGRTVRLTSFVSEILAAVEYESLVDAPPAWHPPLIHVDSDYAFHAGDPENAPKSVFWVVDPEYASQVNYLRQTPVLLECRPPRGPNLAVAAGEAFESFRTYELVYDSTDRERNGLAIRRMYRVLAPWATENPILMHVRSADPASVRRAVDQCADVGFELVIMTFGSGFDIENESPAYRAQVKELVDYAHARGVELGGYTLLASRRISDEDDVIDAATGKPGGAIFGNSPCLGSRWGAEYFRKVVSFVESTGLDAIEHDGSYPGDECASTRHPGHEGLDDSQWRQWKTIAGFYRWCRGRGVYLNVPDWYFLSGASKTAMGYREVNWSLPRELQIVIGRQNIHDGTWLKAPSMGWMFVPLVEYQGGGAAATLEPLAEHLDAYERHLAQNFGAGVQACYRGPRLYDTAETRVVVKRWVDFYKKHRPILDSDIVHLRRPDGRDFDAILHVNPRLREKGLAMVHNPLDQAIRRAVELPLYYTGLTETARIRREDGEAREHRLDRRHRVRVEVEIGPRSSTWLVVE